MGKICGAGVIVAVAAGVAFVTNHPVVGYLAVVAFFAGGLWLLRKSGAPERARMKELFPEEYRDD